MKPYSEACEQNKDPILAVLREAFLASTQVLEIGSGSGQHALYFAKQLPHLIWQPSDLAENLAGINMWLREEPLANLLAPLQLDVSAAHWPPLTGIDAVFSANAVHIMSWVCVVGMFDGIGRVLPNGGMLCLYGPFNYGGTFTSDSNARFDAWLKQRDPLSGVRDFEMIDALAAEQGLMLVQDYAMPVNNRSLVWKKVQ